MDQTTIHNTRELIFLLTGASTLLGVIGGICFWILKTKFVPRSECVIEKEKCHINICRKIDEIKDILNSHSIARNLEQQLLIRRSSTIDANFVKLADKLNSIQPENPISLKDTPNP